MVSYAPELDVSDWLQGPEKKLSDLKGNNPVYLHFFQVNCPACFSNSIPFAENLHKKYSNKGLEVIGIASRFEEWEENSRKNFEDFLKYGKLTSKVENSMSDLYGNQILNSDKTYKIKVTHPVAWDRGENLSHSKTWAMYNCRGTPYEFLIDKEGKVMEKGFHLNDSSTLEDFLKTL